MATPGTVPTATTAPDEPRPDVLAYPSPTTSRFLVFLVALLSAGVFVGVWLHNQVLYDDWLRVVARCNQVTPQQVTGEPAVRAALARTAAAQRCQAGVDRRRAAFAFGGAAAAGTAGLAVLYVVPGLLERRRRLRPLVPALRPAAERVDELATEAGLARAPTLVLGAATQRDGFSYGTPGRYRIALPRAVAVRWRNTALFDPLVRHELAHVAHRDVALSWLARSVWYALAPLLALPVVVILLSRDRSILGDYLWRAVLFAVMVQLVSHALLRSREHDADLRAAQAGGGPEPVAAVVAQVRDPGRSSWYRRLLANHPSPARRLAVLERPELAAGVSFLDGLTAGFLAALAGPLIVQASVPLLMGSLRSDLALVATVLVAGPLLGGSVGLGLWRAALVQRVAGGSVRPAQVAFGVAAGLLLGQVASLAQTGVESLGGVTHPPTLAFVALAGLGATMLVAGLGELCAGAAPAARRARASWLLALLAGSVVFATALWLAGSLELAVDQGSWLIARMWLVTVVGSWPVLAAVAVLALTAAWALRATRQGALTPAWLLERGERRPWPAAGRAGLAEAAVPAVVAGLVGAGGMVALVLVSGPALSAAAKEQRFYASVWVAAAAAAAVTLALALLVPRRGLGVAALAGPLACLVAVAGFLAVNTVRGGRLSVDFAVRTARPSLALGLVLTVLVATAGLPGWDRWRRPRRLWPAAAALGLVLVLTVVAGRNTLVGFGSLSALPGAEDYQRQLAAAETAQYGAVAADVLRRYGVVQAAVAAIDADRAADGPSRAARVRGEVLVPLRALLGDAEAYRPPTPAIQALHRSCLAFLRASVQSFELFASAFERGDAAAFAAARARRDQAGRDFQAWQAGLTALLSGGATPPAGAAGDQAGAGQQAAGAPTGSAPAARLAEQAPRASATASATAPDSVDDAGNPVGYGAANVLDGDRSTAWRVKGDGSGATVTLSLPRATHVTQVGLVPGYAKVDAASGRDRFGENRRVREVRWHFGDGTVTEQRFQDRPVLQRVAVDVVTSRVVIEIVATVPGDPAHDFTAISDVSVAGTG
jgi:Zn-dependent protease with chaperone function